MLLDFSKTNIDADALRLLADLGRASGLTKKRDAMFAGEPINNTEYRAVRQSALRLQDTTPLIVEGQDLRPGVAETLRPMEGFARGEVAGATGAPSTGVVNIGIGGSDLGPAMATRALAPSHDGPHCHFVTNVDGRILPTRSGRSIQPARSTCSPPNPSPRSRP